MSIDEEEKEKLKEFCKTYADDKGFKLQPDPSLLDTIVSGLLRNEEKYGFRYCPCRRVSGNEEEDKKKICPCVFHEQEIKEDGHCKCFLFLRK
ncbi:ferredoxin:thioredoxin reductase [Candidatus Woesearchaeota archaeon]|nr:ferredoxin:thioredoxin reductase [Candidatus Woesearchaeota archaeon]